MCSIYNVFEVVGTFLIIKIGNNYSITLSLYVGIIGTIICLIVIPLCYFIKNYLARYIITLVPISFAAVFSGILIATLNSCSSRIDAKMTSAMLIGLGIAGTLN